MGAYQNVTPGLQKAVTPSISYSIYLQQVTINQY